MLIPHYRLSWAELRALCGCLWRWQRGNARCLKLSECPSLQSCFWWKHLHTIPAHTIVTEADRDRNRDPELREPNVFAHFILHVHVHTYDTFGKNSYYFCSVSIIHKYLISSHEIMFRWICNTTKYLGNEREWLFVSDESQESTQHQYLLVNEYLHLSSESLKC